MRRFQPLRQAMAGLVLISTAAAAADEPPMGPSLAPPTAPKMGLRRGLHKHTPQAGDRLPGPHMCNACAAKMMQQNGGKMPVASGVMGDPTMAPMVVANASCPTCGTGAAMAPSAPGYASVGGGMPGGPVLASAGAPGRAEIGTGGAMAVAEPAPVGVMRTSYGPSAPAPAAAPGMMAGPNGMGMGMAPTAGNIPYARPEEMPYMPPAPRNKRILSHILGIPTARQMTAERDARQKSAHAMISYNPSAGTPTELPASMVYGSGGK